jgi:hypothetical protein
MTTPKQKRGFALLTPAQRTAVSKKGGTAATGRHRWTPSEAAEAGRQSGRARRRKQ